MFKKIVNITLMLFALFLMSAVQAVPSTDDLQSCLVSGGTGDTNGNTYSCCKRVDAFYETCTTCLKGTSGACRTTTTWNPQMSQDTTPTPPKPPTLRDQIKRSNPTISAPAKAKAVTPSQPVITTPIKQHQTIESPAKASQTMSK